MKRTIAIAAAVVCATVVAVLGTAASGGGTPSYQVRAIFDSAFSVIPGEDVKIAGVVVGKIQSLDVTADNKAAVTLAISKPGFGDWRRDATCTIRPQSLIGEKYVECTPTRPRASGEPEPPPLPKIAAGRPGAGEHLLPVTQTSRPVDLDLLNNVLRLPYRERLSILISDFGTGLAGNGRALNAAIKRADPALQSLDRVLQILGDQNRVLSDLAVNSDTVLRPLAARRQQVADFIVKANRVAQATANRRSDLQRNLRLLPPFLRQLKPTMTRLGALSDEMSPVISDLGAESPSLTRFLLQLGPFSRAGIPALRSLGTAADVGRVALPRTLPVIRDVRALTTQVRPALADLRPTLTSFRDSGGIERLMDYLFFQVTSINGFDTVGHYLRAGLIVNTCATYSATPLAGCSAKYGGAQGSAASVRAGTDGNVVLERTRRALAGQSLSQIMAQTGGLPKRRGARSTGAPASAARGARARLRMPRDILPGAPKPAPAAPGASTGGAPASAQGASSSQALLDYLLGSGS